MEVTGETHHFSDGAETGIGLSLTTGVVPHIDIALGAGYVFLVPDEGASESGSGGYDLSATLIAGKSLGNVNLFLNLGYTRIDKTAAGDKSGIFSASLAGEYGLFEVLALVGEIRYESSGAQGEEPPVAVTAGLIWVIADNFSIDIGARSGLTDTAPDWCALAGINYTFGGAVPEEKHEK